MTVIINFGLVPLIIDFMADFEDFRRKSARQLSIMLRVFVF